MKEYKSLLALPLGTRIYVTNGNWHGKICGTQEQKLIFVEEVEATYMIKGNEKLDWTIVKGGS